MGRTRHLFIFKCSKGHETEKIFPLGTRLEDYDETTCAECLKTNVVARAFVVFICPAREKTDGGSRS
jgi:hypothetical protein